MIKRRPVPVDLVNWLLVISGVTNLGAGTVYMVLGNGAMGGAGVVAGLALLFAATIDRFELLKGLGMEAKTRELRKTIDAADEVVARMKRLAEVTTRSLIQLHAKAGRLGGATPPQEGYDLSRSIKGILEGVGADPDAIRKTLEPWAWYAAIDVGQDILSRYTSSLQPLVDKRNRARDDFPQPIRVDDPAWQKVLEAVREVDGYINSLRDVVYRAPLTDISVVLREVAANAPAFVPAESLQGLRSEVDRWAPEIEYLARNLDFKDPATWIERINKIHGSN